MTATDDYDETPGTAGSFDVPLSADGSDGRVGPGAADAGSSPSATPDGAGVEPKGLGGAAGPNRHDGFDWVDPIEMRAPASDADVDAEFSAIVSELSGQMQWGATAADLDAAAFRWHGPAGTVLDDGPGGPGSATSPGGIRPGGRIPDQPPAALPPVGRPPSVGGPRDTADDRRRRREFRRLERAEALAAFQAEQAEIQATRDADDAHFVPPPPPPLPRPKGRTIGAVLLIVAGIVLLAWPGLVEIAPQTTLVLGLLLILGGAVLLFTGLRRHRGGPGDGWDDGAAI